MIKGLTTGLWRETESEEWKDDGQRSLDQSQAREHTASWCWTETGTELPHEVRENAALFSSHPDR